MIRREVRDEFSLESQNDLDAKYGNDLSNEQQVEMVVKQRTDIGDIKTQQEGEFCSIAKSIWKTSRQFDLDSTQKNSPFDILVKKNVLQKSMETDNLIFVEGHRREFQ